MGISILEPPLSRSILLCERAMYAVRGERVRKVVVVVEVESEEKSGKNAEPPPHMFLK